MLWSILRLLIACAVLWAGYQFVFKSFCAELKELGFNFYGLIGKILIGASMAFYLATTFLDLMDTASLPFQMLMGILLLSPGYIIFFLRCFSKTGNIGYTLVALVFMIVISQMAGYFAVMAVMLVILLFVLRAALASAFGSGGGKGTVRCGGCGKSLRIRDGDNPPFTCPHCNTTTW